ncbi:MAG: glycosyltransferase family 4 protein [Patescibacteria group bacterium]
MKIVMIAPTPFFADRGCHTQIYEEIKALEKIGHEIILCTYGLGRDVPGVKIVRTVNLPWYKKLSAGPSYTKILLLPLLAVTSLKTIIKFKPDIIHAHLHEGAVIARFCKLFFPKKSYLFDMQGSLTGECLQHGFIKSGGWGHKVIRFAEKKIAGWFFIITQSDGMLKELLDLGVPANRMANVKDGVDTDKFKPTAPDAALADSLAVDLNLPRIVYLGLLETYQGADLMFAAFALVARQIPRAQFIVIGFPNLEKYREICQNLEISKQVKFLGRIEYDKLPAYLSLADVAVAPKISLTEGDGKIYNYMAMGLPTVAFDRSTSREILGGTGLFAKLNDSADFAEKILYLLANKEQAEILGQAARERAVARLSWTAVGERINNIYLNKI